MDNYKEILSNTKTIAVVGISDRVDRPSHEVAKYLSRYFKIIPVNPKLQEVLGQKCYPNLSAIPAEIKIDLVDIFRRSEDVPPIVQEALQRQVPYIWMQQGIVNEEARQIAEKAGAKVVMDACLAVVHATQYRAI